MAVLFAATSHTCQPDFGPSLTTGSPRTASCSVPAAAAGQTRERRSLLHCLTVPYSLSDFGVAPGSQKSQDSSITTPYKMNHIYCSLHHGRTVTSHAYPFSPAGLTKPSINCHRVIRDLSFGVSANFGALDWPRGPCASPPLPNGRSF